MEPRKERRFIIYTSVIGLYFSVHGSEAVGTLQESIKAKKFMRICIYKYTYQYVYYYHE